MEVEMTEKVTLTVTVTVSHRDSHNEVTVAKTEIVAVTVT